MNAERLTGNPLGCTWLRTSSYGTCSNEAAWWVFDDDHGWFLCERHAALWGIRA